jgi:hypothetical protein
VCRERLAVDVMRCDQYGVGARERKGAFKTRSGGGAGAWQPAPRLLGAPRSSRCPWRWLLSLYRFTTGSCGPRQSNSHPFFTTGSCEHQGISYIHTTFSHLHIIVTFCESTFKKNSFFLNSSLKMAPAPLIELFMELKPKKTTSLIRWSSVKRVLVEWREIHRIRILD